MKETRVSMSENPMSSRCSAITQWFLHAEASPNYMGINKKSEQMRLWIPQGQSTILCIFKTSVYTEPNTLMGSQWGFIKLDRDPACVKITGGSTTNYFLT